MSLVDHGPAVFQRLPSYTNHLYCRPAPPPVASAVQSIVVPGGCGGEGFAANVTVLTGCTGAEVPCDTDAGANGGALGTSSIANAASVVASKSSTELPALRTHTATRYRGLANIGVHRNVLASDQFFTTSHSDPLWSNHLNSYGPMPPFGVAVQVIVVPGPCGTERSAPSITALARADEIGGAKVDDVLMDIRARFSKAQARTVIAWEKSDDGCA